MSRNITVLIPLILAVALLACPLNVWGSQVGGFATGWNFVSLPEFPASSAAPGYPVEVLSAYDPAGEGWLPSLSYNSIDG